MRQLRHKNPDGHGEGTSPPSTSLTPISEGVNGRRPLEMPLLLLEYVADKDRQYFSGRTVVFHASLGGLIRIAVLLMDAGADMDLQNHSGMTPLQVATSAQAEMASLLSLSVYRPS